MNPSIVLHNVSKSFRNDHASLLSLIMNPSSAKGVSKKVLDNISFSLMPGERVSLCGRNGAGKSTLLKIISRVIQPDEGQVIVAGKTASLLELGIGFNPELTGVENVYFYGALMGKNKREVDLIFDEICDFADIGDDIGRPVKSYSSGMFQRLAFASAFATRPDILIADEGLSVGDIAFQQKCYTKIDSLAANGTTILVVSHSSEAILRITDRTIWLEGGHIHMDGATHEVDEQYKSYMKLISKSRVTDVDGTDVNVEIHVVNYRATCRISLSERFYQIMECADDEISDDEMYSIVMRTKQFFYARYGNNLSEKFDVNMSQMHKEIVVEVRYDSREVLTYFSEKLVDLLLSTINSATGRKILRDLARSHTLSQFGNKSSKVNEMANKLHEEMLLKKWTLYEGMVINEIASMYFDELSFEQMYEIVRYLEYRLEEFDGYIISNEDNSFESLLVLSRDVLRSCLVETITNNPKLQYDKHRPVHACRSEMVIDEI